MTQDRFWLSRGLPGRRSRRGQTPNTFIRLRRLRPTGLPPPKSNEPSVGEQTVESRFFLILVPAVLTHSHGRSMHANHPPGATERLLRHDHPPPNPRNQPKCCQGFLGGGEGGFTMQHLRTSYLRPARTLIGR